MNKSSQAEIGIVGGSGFYDLATSLVEIKTETPYGPPSGRISIGQIAGKKVAFLPRHSQYHEVPPHQINYRANIWALKELGVRRIITSHAVGSLQANIHPGDIVVLDQFVDRTKGRIDTFYDGQIATHVSLAFPYCPQLRKVASAACRRLNIPTHEKGTVVVIQGPRFSTAAESTWFTNNGWEVINMTEYPEVALAREKEICYLALALVTDYDAGLVAQGLTAPVSAKEVKKVFGDNIQKAKKVILEIISSWPTRTSCSCQESLKNARL